MLQVLTSIGDFERITKIAKENKRTIKLIGFLDEDYKDLKKGDLVMYLGSPKPILGWGKQVMTCIEFKLFNQGFIIKPIRNTLKMFDDTLVEYTHSPDQDYYSGFVSVKLIDGLNCYGITGHEVYTWMLKATDSYLKSISKEGDD